MSTKQQRRKLAAQQRTGDVKYKQPHTPSVVFRRNIPVAVNTEVSRSRSFYGECFEPKSRVAVFPNFVE